MELIYQYKLQDKLNVLNVMVWDLQNLEILVNVLNAMEEEHIWLQEDQEI